MELDDVFVVRVNEGRGWIGQELLARISVHPAMRRIDLQQSAGLEVPDLQTVAGGLEDPAVLRLGLEQALFGG